MQRYSVIKDKNPREIVLLRGCGCRYKRCAFCDYHEDASQNEQDNLFINKAALSHVTGCFGVLEVINSGSFCELNESTMCAVEEVCRLRKIKTVHFECHWLYRNYISQLRKRFAEIGTHVKVKTGIETFDSEYREQVMLKGIQETEPELLSKDFDECCLLFGLPGQTVKSMINDIEIGLKWFERVCVNLMIENSTKLKPDNKVRKIFIEDVYPKYKNNSRVDILLNNTDFGVGTSE